MTTFSFLFLFWTPLLAYISAVQAETRSIIVDDAATNEIIYSKGWNKGEECRGCAAQPDKSKARDGTWHDGTESADRLDEVFLIFTFTGTSVEVWYTAIDIIGPWTTNTNVSYSLDGNPKGVKERKSTNQTDYLYNQSLFRLDGLPNAEHTLRVDLQRPGVLLFDYLVYTEENVDAKTTTSRGGISSSSAPPGPSTSPIFASGVVDANVGAIVGGVLSGVIAFILACTCWYCRKVHRERAQARLAPTPIVNQVPTFYPPTKLAGQPTYNSPYAEHGGAAPQSILPVYHNTHSGSGLSSEVPSGILPISLGTSQGPSMSTSISVPHQPGHFHPSTNRNQIISPSVDEPAQLGLVSRHYSPQSLPPPYSPNPG